MHSKIIVFGIDEMIRTSSHAKYLSKEKLIVQTISKAEEITKFLLKTAWSAFVIKAYKGKRKYEDHGNKSTN